MSYLKEILTGDYSNYTEDRLSQIFSASFNSSNLFKKIFFKTINLNIRKLSDYRSMTQINYGLSSEDARIDIIIYNRNKPYVIIENKVNAPLTIKQLEKYDKIKELNNCRKLAIVKHFFARFTENTKWEIFHWVDFYSKFKKEFEKGIPNPVDQHIIENFIEHLELMNMARVNKITNTDLINFADTINKIRTDGKAYVSLTNKNIFETGIQFLSILEEIIDLAHQEPLLMKSVGKNFRYNPWIDYWAEDEFKENNNLNITININLTKKINNIKSLGTGLFLYNDDPKNYSLVTYAMNKPSEDYVKESYYEKNDLVFDEYANQVINSWKKWLKKA